MNPEYVLNVIKGVLSMNERRGPRNVSKRELVRSILEDLEMSIESLKESGQITIHDGINDTLYEVVG